MKRQWREVKMTVHEERSGGGQIGADVRNMPCGASGARRGMVVALCLA